MNTVLEARQVKKVYGARGNVHTALQHIDLSVSEGEFVGVMGPSGSGKSTLLHLLATLDEPTSGEVRIDGTPIADMNEQQLTAFRRDKLGFLFQDYNLLDTLTVRENIALPLALARFPTPELMRRVEAVAERFGIGELLEQYPYHLSGGQKQRTAACRAIVARPRLLLADEPTGALDSRAASELLESLSALNRSERTTIVMVTHDALAASYCRRVVFIKDGALFTEADKGDLSRKAFFRSILNVLSALGGGIHDTD